MTPVRSVVWFADPGLRSTGVKLVSGELGVTVSSLDQARAANDGESVYFVDAKTIGELGKMSTVPEHVIAVSQDPLPVAVGWLHEHPWLSHVTSAGLLAHPVAGTHIKNVIATMTTDKPRLLDWLGPEVSGRRVRMSHASRRVERLDRMREFMAENGIAERTIEQLRDAAEELLTNAFYDAPVTAGAYDQPISRELDVALPDKYACDLAYGVHRELAIVRVRDPFGSLSRRRLVEVLSRCARTDMQVEVDESMGGAGLGMWRIFTAATFVAVSVVKHGHTEILVGIAKRAPGPKPFAFHLFFREAGKPRFWRVAHEDSEKPALNQSIVLAVKK